MEFKSKSNQVFLHYNSTSQILAFSEIFILSVQFKDVCESHAIILCFTEFDQTTAVEYSTYEHF